MLVESFLSFKNLKFKLEENIKKSWKSRKSLVILQKLVILLNWEYLVILVAPANHNQFVNLLFQADITEFQAHICVKVEL